MPICVAQVCGHASRLHQGTAVYMLLPVCSRAFDGRPDLADAKVIAVIEVGRCIKVLDFAVWDCVSPNISTAPRKAVLKRVSMQGI